VCVRLCVPIAEGVCMHVWYVYVCVYVRICMFLCECLYRGRMSENVQRRSHRNTASPFF